MSWLAELACTSAAGGAWVDEATNWSCNWSRNAIRDEMTDDER